MFRFQAANIVGGQYPQGCSDRRQLGTEPLVLRPVVVTFRLDPIILVPKPLEPVTDDIAFHPDPNAVLLESAEFGENPTEHLMDRLVLALGDSPCGLAGLQIGMRVFEPAEKLVHEIGVNTSRVRLYWRLHLA